MRSVKTAPMIDWDNLRAFLAAVRAGSYTAAARTLRVDRTTVGRRLERLEQEIGTPIFEQGEDGYHPTPVGRRALELADAVDQLVDQFLVEVRQTRPPSANQLRIVVSAELGAELMPELAAFARSHPDVRLRLSSSPDPAKTVIERKSEIGVCLADERPEHLRGSRVGILRQAPYATTGYLDRRGHGRPPQDYDWIRCDRWSRIPMMRRWDAIFCETVSVAANVDSWDGLRSAVEADLGAAFLWTFAARANPDLRPVAAVDETLGVGLWLLARDDVPLDPAARTFMHEVGPLLADKLS